MQLINVLGTALLLASTIIAAPGSKSTGNLLEKRWWWEGSDNSDDLGEHQGTWKNDDDYGDNGEYHGSKDELASWTSSSSCATTTRSTVHVTTTISVTHTTTITKYRTLHSHTTKHAITSSINANSPSIAIILSTGFSTGIPSSSAPISLIYTNTSTMSIPLSTAYSTGIPSSSTPTSLLYTNTSRISILLSTADSTGVPSSSHLASVLFINITSISVTPFTTHKNTYTQKHHSHHKATSITVSSMIFIAASSSIPTMGSATSKLTTVLPVTTTVSGTIAPTGTPIPHALLCGVHGFPVGDFFLGQLVESKPGVDITLQSCYEFCAGIYGIDLGCLSIEFYPEPGTDAPRCNLYSEGVAESLDIIISQVPNVWYDLGCGVPTS